MDLTNWETPDVYHLVTPANDSDWLAAVGAYMGSRNDMPLLRCLQVARANGAQTLVIETRYLDLDYRSQYSVFFSRLFTSVLGSTHRLHFFRAVLNDDQVWNLPGDPGYLGYVVVRPVNNGPVSRAMLAPPSDIADAIRTKVSEEVTFFGQPLSVTGVPFAQQDTQLGVCAHAAAWVCYQTAYLRGEVARRPAADFSVLANQSFYPGRALPSGGLNAFQLSDLFRTFDLPAIFYQSGALPSERLPWQSPAPQPPQVLPGQQLPAPGT